MKEEEGTQYSWTSIGPAAHQNTTPCYCSIQHFLWIININSYLISIWIQSIKYSGILSACMYCLIELQCCFIKKWVYIHLIINRLAYRSYKQIIYDLDILQLVIVKVKECFCTVGVGVHNCCGIFQGAVGEYRCFWCWSVSTYIGVCWLQCSLLEIQWFIRWLHHSIAGGKEFGRWDEQFPRLFNFMTMEWT